MKKIITLFLVASSLFVSGQTTSSTNSLSAEQIVDNYTKAMGGLEAFKAIKTAKMTGVLTVQGMDLPLSMVVINGKAVRTDVDAMGQSITSAYLDGKGWKLNPLQGINVPTDVEGAELAELKLQSSLASGLMDHENLGNTLTFLGDETIEGIKTYKIQMTTPDQRKSTYFISTSDFMLIKSLASREVMGQTVEVETIFSDVKQFGDTKFVMTRTQSVEGNVFQVIKFTNVELNAPVEEQVFNK
jgi:hypothetical protein